MKWRKLGKIFDPAEHNLADGYEIFAKSPQALVFDNFVRIYFCAQKKTLNGKYVSCPHFVDFAKNFRKIIRISAEPVIALGELGHFDEHGIFPMNVLRNEGRILAFTTGWSRRRSVSIDMEIGFAESFDGGNTFVKPNLGGPIMAPNLNEPFMVGDAFVQYRAGSYHMWYIFGDKWHVDQSGADPERFYRIAYATSLDGLRWVRDSRYIIATHNPTECQALPSVITIDGVHHMYFCYRDAFDFRNNTENAYRLGYAFSTDGETWTRNDDEGGIGVSESGWDSEMMCYPNIFECDGSYYLLYNGNEFGKHGFGIAVLVNN